MDLSHNKLTTIHATTLKEGSILYLLNLSYNKIAYLEGDWSNLKKLNILILKNNKLVHFRQDIFDTYLQNSKSFELELQIQRNSFKCGCDIVWLRETSGLNNTNLFVIGDRLCKTPKDVYLTHLLFSEKERSESAIEEAGRGCTKCLYFNINKPKSLNVFI